MRFLGHREFEAGETAELEQLGQQPSRVTEQPQLPPATEPQLEQQPSQGTEQPPLPAAAEQLEQHPSQVTKQPPLRLPPAMGYS